MAGDGGHTRDGAFLFLVAGLFHMARLFYMARLFLLAFLFFLARPLAPIVVLVVLAMPFLILVAPHVFTVMFAPLVVLFTPPHVVVVLIVFAFRVGPASVVTVGLLMVVPATRVITTHVGIVRFRVRVCRGSD